MRLAKHIGTRIREVRDGKGLTQMEIGAQNYVSAVERGEKNLTLRQVEVFAERLHADPVALLSGDDSVRLREQLEIARQTLRDLRKEVRSGYAKHRIDNALRETEP